MMVFIVVMVGMRLLVIMSVFVVMKCFVPVMIMMMIMFVIVVGTIKMIGRVIADLCRICLLLCVDELGVAVLNDIALHALPVAASTRAAMARTATVGAVF